MNIGIAYKVVFIIIIQKNHLLVNEKGDVGMAKRFSKNTETREDLSPTCILNKSYVKMPVNFNNVLNLYLKKLMQKKYKKLQK